MDPILGNAYSLRPSISNGSSHPPTPEITPNLGTFATNLSESNISFSEFKKTDTAVTMKVAFELNGISVEKQIIIRFETPQSKAQLQGMSNADLSELQSKMVASALKCYKCAINHGIIKSGDLNDLRQYNFRDTGKQIKATLTGTSSTGLKEQTFTPLDDVIEGVKAAVKVYDWFISSSPPESSNKTDKTQTPSYSQAKQDTKNFYLNQVELLLAQVDRPTYNPRNQAFNDPYTDILLKIISKHGNINSVDIAKLMNDLTIAMNALKGSPDFREIQGQHDALKSVLDRLLPSEKELPARTRSASAPKATPLVKSRTSKTYSPVPQAVPLAGRQRAESAPLPPPALKASPPPEPLPPMPPPSILEETKSQIDDLKISIKDYKTLLTTSKFEVAERDLSVLSENLDKQVDSEVEIKKINQSVLEIQKTVNEAKMKLTHRIRNKLVANIEKILTTIETLRPTIRQGGDERKQIEGVKKRLESYEAKLNSDEEIDVSTLKEIDSAYTQAKKTIDLIFPDQHFD